MSGQAEHCVAGSGYENTDRKHPDIGGENSEQNAGGSACRGDNHGFALAKEVHKFDRGDVCKKCAQHAQTGDYACGGDVSAEGFGARWNYGN